MPSGYGWEQGWVTNKAGFKFHNWFGFGVINVDEAVFMAKNYSSKLDPYHETSWFTSSAINSAIPDFSAAGVTHSISAPVNVKIEGVRIKVKINHSNISHLGLELTSPAGTKSIIVNAANSMTGVVNYVGSEVFLSNAFYGESSSGTWTLKVIDAVSGSTGSLKEWSINFVGGQ
jgi:subtilisin-like proprotein convertase family protein